MISSVWIRNAIGDGVGAVGGCGGGVGSGVVNIVTENIANRDRSQGTTLMVILHWFRQWIGPVRQRVITRTAVDAILTLDLWYIHEKCYIYVFADINISRLWFPWETLRIYSRLLCNSKLWDHLSQW